MFLFLVTPCLAVAVHLCMEWIPIKKKENTGNSKALCVVFLFLVTPCLAVAVHLCMEWIPIKKKENTGNSKALCVSRKHKNSMISAWVELSKIWLADEYFKLGKSKSWECKLFLNMNYLSKYLTFLYLLTFFFSFIGLIFSFIGL